MSRHFIAIFLLAHFTLSISACGYALVGRGSSLPPNVKSVAIPLFENRTGEPQLDTILTNAVSNRFITDGRLPVVSIKNGDTTLKGVINNYSIRPVAFDEANNASEYVVDLGVRVTFIDNRDGKILNVQKIRDSWRYDVQSSISGAEAGRKEAIQIAAEKMSENIVSVIIEAF